MALPPAPPGGSWRVGPADTIALPGSTSRALLASMTAAVAAASAMGRFYLWGKPKGPASAHASARLAVALKARRRLRYACLTIALMSSAPIARAQNGAPIAPPNNDTIQVPSLGSTLTVSALADLPSSGGNLFTLLDTVIAEVISDRVDSGGVNVGGAPRPRAAREPGAPAPGCPHRRRHPRRRRRRAPP